MKTSSRNARIFKRKNRYTKRRTLKKQLGGAFTKDNTYIYIGHGKDIHYDLPEDRPKIPEDCVYVNAQIHGLVTYTRPDDLTALYAFAVNDIFRDPNKNKSDINMILNRPFCIGLEGEEYKSCDSILKKPTWYSIGVYNPGKYYINNIFQPFPIYPVGGHKHFLMWGGIVGGLMSAQQVLERLGRGQPEIKFMDLYTGRDKEDFPKPGLYRTLNFAKIRKFYEGCTYPSTVEFDNFKKNYSGIKMNPWRPSAQDFFPDLTKNEDIELDTDEVKFLVEKMETTASDLMAKFPGIHYNLLCRPAPFWHDSPTEIAEHRANSLEQHPLGPTLLTSFYFDELSVFQATWDELFSWTPFMQLLDALNIPRDNPKLIDRSYLDEIDPQKRLNVRLGILIDWLKEQGQNNIRGGRNYNKAIDNAAKIAHIEASLARTFCKPPPRSKAERQWQSIESAVV